MNNVISLQLNFKLKLNMKLFPLVHSHISTSGWCCCYLAVPGACLQRRSGQGATWPGFSLFISVLIWCDCVCPGSQAGLCCSWGWWTVSCAEAGWCGKDGPPQWSVRHHHHGCHGLWGEAPPTSHLHLFTALNLVCNTGNLFWLDLLWRFVAEMLFFPLDMIQTWYLYCINQSACLVDLWPNDRRKTKANSRRSLPG